MDKIIKIEKIRNEIIHNTYILIAPVPVPSLRVGPAQYLSKHNNPAQGVYSVPSPPVPSGR